MARQDFIEQLKTLGYAVEVLAVDRIAFRTRRGSGNFEGSRLLSASLSTMTSRQIRRADRKSSRGCFH